MLRSRRFAFAAAAVLLGLSACGDSNPRTTPASTPPVIQLGAGAASTAGDAEVASGRMMMPMQEITFVYQGDAPDLGAEGGAWTLPAGAQIDVERVARIAALLGVEGDVREVPADQGGGWMVGAADYSTASLTVSSDGMLSWWYNPAPMPSVDVSCVLPVDEVTVAANTATTEVAVSGEMVPSCAAPEPPANVPDDAAAQADAESLFAGMGYDTDALEYDVYADEWGASVTGWLLLDGARSPIAVSVGFGADGVVTWASGALAEPQRASDYPLVGVEAAVARLNDESGQWMQYGVSPMVAARMEVSGGTGVAAATVVGGSDDTQSEPGEAGSVTATGEATPVTDVGGAPASLPDQIGEPVQIVPTGCDASAPCESYVPEAPEAITVTLTDVHLGLSMVWAQDGTVWLLPAYTFTAADDGQYSVIAVDDSFIALPDPVLVDPMPIEPAPETVPVDPASVPAETTVVPPSDGSATSVDLGAAQEVLVGLTVEEATRVAADNGWTVRVSTLEGEPQPVTMDLQSNRVNLSVADGIVTGLDGIG